jgi:hypothetical protein
MTFISHLPPSGSETILGFIGESHQAEEALNFGIKENLNRFLSFERVFSITS